MSDTAFLGLRRVLPVVLQRDQHLDVILDRDGKFLELRETMPPRRNYARLDQPTRVEEKLTREMEWSEAEREWFFEKERPARPEVPDHPNYREQHQRIGEATV